MLTLGVKVIYGTRVKLREALVMVKETTLEQKKNRVVYEVPCSEVGVCCSQRGQNQPLKQKDKRPCISSGCHIPQTWTVVLPLTLFHPILT